MAWEHVIRADMITCGKDGITDAQRRSVWVGGGANPNVYAGMGFYFRIAIHRPDPAAGRIRA